APEGQYRTEAVEERPVSGNLGALVVVATRFGAERKVRGGVEGKATIHEHVRERQEGEVPPSPEPFRRAPEQTEAQGNQQQTGKKIGPPPTEATVRAVGQVADQRVVYPVPNTPCGQG